MPAFQRVFFFSNFLNHAFSYKVKKAPDILGVKMAGAG